LIRARWPKVVRRTGDASNWPPLTIESKFVEDASVSLEISFGGAFWEKLEKFLREKMGFLTDGEKAEAIALLLEYGAPVESTAKELTMAEKFAVGASHSSLKFKMFECFQENKAIAVGLAVNLAHNKSLKKQLAKWRGAGTVPHNEWDAWDDTKVSEYLNRYLFVK